ncbi:hypothetical protein JCM5350_000678 [Sporobolomyces pararoseus]
MSLKQELQTWSNALVAFDENDYDQALTLFRSMEPGSKILFNIGLIHATRGEHELAIEAFEKAIELDSYLAVAYFQAGVSRFLLKQFEEARRDFDDAWLYLRSNEIIDYEQIGLKFQLYSCEVLFNRGLCQIYMGRVEDGLRDWTMAIKEKYTQEHDVIDEAYVDRGQGYTVFSVSVGTVFRPSDSKLANLEPRNFLGKTTVIAAANPFDLHLDFQKAVPPIKPSSAAPSPPQASEVKDQRGAKLSRSQTVAARLENSIDGIARPLRRRPTLEERKAVEGRPKRSQTVPPPSSQSDVNHSRPVLAPTTGSLPRLDSPERTRHVRSASVAEKRNRRQGLTIQVPPLPAPLSTFSPSSSTVLARPTYLEPPHRRTASVPSLSATSPRPRTPHLRSASLPSPNVAVPPPPPLSGHQPISLRRNQYPCSIKRSLPHPSPQPSSSNQNPSSLPQSRQDSNSSTSPHDTNISRSVSKSSSSSSYSKLCLSPVSEENQRTSSPSSASTTSGSALLAYLQEAEKNTGIEEERVEKTVVAKGIGEEEEKLRIRLRYRGQVRAMILPRGIKLVTLVERIRLKLQSSRKFALSFEDSDGCLISLVDEEDWQSALDAVASLDTRRLEIIVEEED